MNVIKQIMENVNTMGNKSLLADDTLPKGITMGQLGVMSGKVYAYLKKHEIGKEDFVMLCLPRGIQPLIAMLGVWRAGAAFVIVEDNYAPERIAYIRKDCGCKLVIDAEVWESIMETEAMDGFEPVGEHDAAFAVYTSGTTGNPKGVLHEYGNLERMMQSVCPKNGEPIVLPDDRFALVAPLNFVASLIITLTGMYIGIFLYVVPYSVLKNPMAMMMFLIKNKITGTFLTPSYIRKMTKKPPMLKFCIIGSEPANGVYLEGLKIHNIYTMSEVGFAVARYLIDRKYEEAPVGKSQTDVNILLLDEQGQEVSQGEEGEVCFDNRYVRGYINLPEENQKAFVNGIYHTGDLGKLDGNGNLIICGRLNDMVKINGNRVEPGEIENVAKRVLNINSAAVKIFDDGNRVFICAYYTDNIKVDFEKTRKAMEKYLPYYMLPSFFIHIDQYPLTATGKLSRKELPAPDFSAYQDDYAAPRDEVEKALCEAFEKVLHLQRAGIHDDFYQLGGDSLGAMEVIVQSGLRGISATDIFRGHTPEKIAALYKENNKNIHDVDPEEENNLQIKKAHPLTTEQLYMVDYQLYTPKSTMYNLNSMLKFDKTILDMERLAEAVNEAVMNHPALLSVMFFDEDGEMKQRYAPELFHRVSLEKVSEAELDIIKENLVKPFKIVNSCLIRARVFETEEAGYLFLDVHHTVFDGTSSKVFFANVLRAYAGQDLEPDYYYYILSAREQLAASDFYLESKKYFEEKYDGKDWCKHPSTDRKTRENKDDELYVMLPITMEQLDRIEEKYRVSYNAFFVTAALLTTAIYEKKPDILISWIYNGRNNVEEMSSVGLLFRDLPVGISFRKDMNLKELYTQVTDQTTEGIAHSCYSYIEGNSNVVEDDTLCVLYQDKLRSVEDIPGLLEEMELKNPYAASQNIMDMQILNQEEGLMLVLDYTGSLFKTESIEKFRKIYCATIEALCAHIEDDTITMKKMGREISQASQQGGFLSENWWLRWMK